ncbi:MAG: MFS transporter [Ilumatobacteraceae bacterium]|nr:MFS transporter [Ilumatobacter sp.]MCO5329642.1 MFS transporter [Ilumatobacteraceae bacterium]
MNEPAPTECRQPLPRNVKVLSAVSLAQDAGSEMLYPFLPAFITGVLGAPVVAVGVAEGAADLAAAGMKLVSGRKAPAGRRRPWIAAGYGLAAVGKAIVAVAFVWPVVLLGRVVDRVGKGIRGTPRDAMIADAVPAADRGRAFGFHRAMDTLGAVIGPLLGLALYHLLDGRIRWVLLAALVPAVLSASLVSLVREHRREDAVDGPATAPAAAAAAPTAPPVRPPLPPVFRRAMIPLAAFAVVNSSDALLLQRAHDLGVGLSWVVVAYILFNTLYAGLAYPAGTAGDRFGHRTVLAVGVAVFAVVYLGLGLSTSSTAVWVFMPLYGAYAALTDGVARAWVSQLAGDTARSYALGVHGALTGVGVLVAGLWAGLAWGPAGRLPLTVSGAVAAVVAVWLFLGRRSTQTVQGD